MGAVKTELLRQAERIAEEFRAILREDEELDRKYAANQAEIDRNYRAKLAQLESVKLQRITAAKEQDGLAQADILAALDALSRAETAAPERYKRQYRPSGISPKMPDYEALNELAFKISDDSLSGSVKRLTGTGGYSSMADMTAEYLNAIEAGRMYLEAERRKSMDYAAREEAEAEADYAGGTAMAVKRRADLMSENDRLHEQAEQALQDRLIRAVKDPKLKRFDEALAVSLEEFGAYDDTWMSCEPRVSCPDQIMIGAAAVPLGIPSPADSMIRERMPAAYGSGRDLCVPVTADMSKLLRLLVTYEESRKGEVMEGIQSILLKWIRFMPMYSFHITYIDPVDRGTNLGRLQRLEEITAWDLCGKVYASGEDITKRLRELVTYVDMVCSRLAGIESVYDYNRNHEPPIERHLLVINDFPDKFDRAAQEMLKVLIHNSGKCGISMIFTKSGEDLELPGLPGDFLRIHAMAGVTTITIDGRPYEFRFDSVCSCCDRFLSQVTKQYTSGVRIDNRFRKYFSLSGSLEYRESTQSLLIPFALDYAGRLVELELGGALTTHALLSGTTGSGKSTTLQMLITSIILNYHPDDVELWLVDYNKVEFAEYIANPPLHVRLIGLERGAEFTFSLLKKIDGECRRRMERFKQAGVSDITEYKKTFGVRSLPRMILIIDEFHQMTQAIQNEPEYVMILENILSEYRKFGLSCVLCDQAISDGLRGLTEKGRKQIRTRLAMANDLPEIRETLAVDSSYYDDALMNKINHMDKGDVIFKRGVRDAAGDVRTVLDRYRTVLVTREERAACIAWAKRRAGSYTKKELIIVDGKGRKRFDESAVEQYEAEHGGPSPSRIPVYVGTPATLDPCFCFTLQDRLDSNIMIIGADTEMRAGMILYTISCFARIPEYEVMIFADRKDELYLQFRGELESLTDGRIHIVEEPEEMCSYIFGLLDRKKNDSQIKTLMVWLGIESIGADFGMFPKKPDKQEIHKTQDNHAINSLIDEIDSMLAKLDEDDNRILESAGMPEETAAGGAYDAREDIAGLIELGPRFGIHTLVTYSSVKLLRQSRFVKPESFEHKIALAMSRDDWSDYLERVRYIADLDNLSAVYYDGGSTAHVFRPYLIG